MMTVSLVGRTTSGGYGWRTGKSLALAMVKPEHAALGTKCLQGRLDIRFEIYGRPTPPIRLGNHPRKLAIDIGKRGRRAEMRQPVIEAPFADVWFGEMIDHHRQGG